jgi:hypothetical protein
MEAGKKKRRKKEKKKLAGKILSRGRQQQHRT